MKFTITTLVLALAALTSAAAVGQNDGRPVATGSCCVADTSLKEDACVSTSGAAGRCVPGGNACKLYPLPIRAVLTAFTSLPLSFV